MDRRGLLKTVVGFAAGLIASKAKTPSPAESFLVPLDGNGRQVLADGHVTFLDFSSGRVIRSDNMFGLYPPTVSFDCHWDPSPDCLGPEEDC